MYLSVSSVPFLISLQCWHHPFHSNFSRHLYIAHTCTIVWTPASLTFPFPIHAALHFAGMSLPSVSPEALSSSCSSPSSASSCATPGHCRSLRSVAPEKTQLLCRGAYNNNSPQGDTGDSFYQGFKLNDKQIFWPLPIMLAGASVARTKPQWNTMLRQIN